MNAVMASLADPHQFPQKLVLHVLVGEVVHFNRWRSSAPFAHSIASLHDQITPAPPFGRLEVGLIGLPSRYGTRF